MPYVNENNKSNDLLSPARRWSGLYTVGLMILLLLFFAIHQRQNTGFFTDKFKLPEMVALYLPIMLSMVAPILRMVQGRAEPAHLVEGVYDVCLALGSLYLRNIYPFSFTHLADVFPPTIQIGLSWINDNIGRLILLLQVIIGFLSALATFGGYYTERKKRQERADPD